MDNKTTMYSSPKNTSWDSIRDIGVITQSRSYEMDKKLRSRQSLRKAVEHYTGSKADPIHIKRSESDYISIVDETESSH